MRMLCILAASCLTACASKPVVDLRSSENLAQFYQRDLMECQQLVESSRSWLDKPLLGVDLMLSDCLEGRGHNVLN